MEIQRSTDIPTNPYTIMENKDKGRNKGNCKIHTVSRLAVLLEVRVELNQKVKGGRNWRVKPLFQKPSTTPLLRRYYQVLHLEVNDSFSSPDKPDSPQLLLSYYGALYL